VEIDSGARRRLRSGFSGGDEQISEGFEKDEKSFELLCNFPFLYGPVYKKVGVML
jgi:hypothetical protein